MKVKNKYFKLKKRLSVYRNENGERGTDIKSYNAASKVSEEYAKKLILDEIFYYESSPEEWERMEELIGFKKSELIAMSFEDFVVAVHKYYIISIDYDVVEYEPGEGFGGAVPYTE